MPGKDVTRATSWITFRWNFSDRFSTFFSRHLFHKNLLFPKYSQLKKHCGCFSQYKSSFAAISCAISGAVRPKSPIFLFIFHMSRNFHLLPQPFNSKIIPNFLSNAPQQLVKIAKLRLTVKLVKENTF